MEARRRWWGGRADEGAGRQAGRWRHLLEQCGRQVERCRRSRLRLGERGHHARGLAGHVRLRRVPVRHPALLLAVILVVVVLLLLLALALLLALLLLLLHLGVTVLVVLVAVLVGRRPGRVARIGGRRGAGGPVLQQAQGAQAEELADAVPKPAGEVERQQQRRSSDAVERLEVPRNHARRRRRCNHRAVRLQVLRLLALPRRLLALHLVGICLSQVALQVLQAARQRVAEPRRHVELLVTLRKLAPRVLERLEERRQDVVPSRGAPVGTRRGAASLWDAAVEERVGRRSDVAARAGEQGLQRRVADAVAKDGAKFFHPHSLASAQRQARGPAERRYPLA